MTTTNYETISTEIASFISSNKAFCLSNSSSSSLAITALKDMALVAFKDCGLPEVILKQAVRFALMRSFNVNLPPL